MTSRRPNHRLRALLREADWTQEDLARAINRLGAEIGQSLRYDRTAVAHWLAGTNPRPPAPQLAAEAFSRRTGRSITPEIAGFPRDKVAPLPEDAIAGFTALRNSGYRTPGGPVGVAHRPYRMAEATVSRYPLGQLGPPVSRGGATGETIALQKAATTFAAALDRHGGLHARHTLAAYLADDVAPLLAVRRPPRLRAELLAGASQLAFLLARMYEDGRAQGLAQQYYGYAHRLAADAGDRATWCVAVRAMSSQADRLGQLLSALPLAEAAARAAGDAPPGQRSYVRAQLAVVLARCGDRRAALTTLTAAERDAVRTTQGGGPFESYSSAALLYQSALTLEALGDTSAALRCLRDSAAERSGGDLRGQTLTQARYGQLLLRAGYLDEACAAWRSFLDGRDRLRSEEVEHSVQEMCCALLPFRNYRGAVELLARCDQPMRPTGTV